jgi:hypothetical protein
MIQNSSIFIDMYLDPSGAKKLAVAKILTMLQDLAGRSVGDQGEKGYNKIKAYQWFFGGRSDIQEWCDMAERHIDDVRRKAREVYEHGYTWRAAPGQGKRYEERKLYRQRALREQHGLELR